MTYTMRPDMTNNLWFIESDKRLFIRDLYGVGGGVCAPISINESSPNFVCTATKPLKVSSAEASEIAKTTGYIFGKVETDSNGQISSYITCV
ncbi:MAG: hypothetical protein ABSA75_06540 [Candidatus Bathyarchaeia archaeon]